MKNFFDYALPAIIAIVVAIVTFLIGNEGVNFDCAWLAAAFAGWASGSAVAIGYAIGCNDGWGVMGIDVVLSLVFSMLAAWSMTLG